MHCTRSRAMLLALAVGTSMAAPVMAQTMSNDQAMTGMSTASRMMMAPKGRFTGSKDHSASGSYSITGTGKDRTLDLGSDFKVDKAPDIYVILARGTIATGAGALNLGRLKKLAGGQSYQIPASADLSSYTNLLLWCKKYGVLIGEAPLASTMDKGAMGSMDHGSMDQGAMMDTPAMAKDTMMMKPMATDTGMNKP